jgi:hypothetical protein
VGSEQFDGLDSKRQREAEDLRSSMLRLQANILNQNPVADKGTLIETAYQWIKTQCETALFRLQAEAIGQIDPLLTKLPPAPQTRGYIMEVW